MNEKRFQITTNPMSKAVAFDEKEKKYHIGIELEDLLNELSDENGQLKEENEQLRKTINEVIELLLEEVDLFSDKATEHDIISYKEMNQFDNKDAYSMCNATKKAIEKLKRCLDD